MLRLEPLKRLLPDILADIGVARVGVVVVLGVLVRLVLGVLVLLSCISMGTLTSGCVCVLLREFIEVEGDVTSLRDAAQEQSVWLPLRRYCFVRLVQVMIL